MKLSIITINYNNSKGLKWTLNSLLNQSSLNFEHIIVDGASTDDSVNIIQEYQQSLASNSSLTLRLKWISEPDTGIYNAMNKGLSMANGEYILMLNSGDYFVDNQVIKNVIPLLDGTDIIQGNIIEDNMYRNRGYGKSDIDFFEVMKGRFLHQASFCKKDLFDKYGFFDESYKIIGDTKFFMISLGIKNATFKYVDIDVTNYDMNGISSGVNSKWLDLQISENERLRKELFSERLNVYFERNAKKIKLYDKLHRCKLMWYIVMMMIHIYDMFSVEITDVKREKLSVIKK